MLEKLKQEVYEANMGLAKYGLVTFTWGNVSGIDRETGLIVIKPSGVPYEELSPDKMVVMDLEGNVLQGDLSPSSDAPTHLVLYRAFSHIGGVVHTHSTYTTAFAQAGQPIRTLGTTHADYFYGDIPVTRPMSKAEITGQYEKETGNLIVNYVQKDIPAVLVHGHGPFAWGSDADNALHNAVVLEEVAKMACLTISIAPAANGIQQTLIDKHFLRKHGADAYYGQGDKQ